MLETKNEKDFYQWLGQQFKAKREQKGLKQKEVADRAEISQGDLSKFENKGKKLSAYRLILLLKAISVSMDELIGDAEKKKLSFTLDTDEIGQLSNGEKMAFAEKVKLFFKVAFSERMLREMALDLEREQLEREAAAQHNA